MKGRAFRLADSAYTDLDRYIDRLVAESSPEYTAWNVEQHRANKPVKWNYVDGCMMTALLNMAQITGEKRYFDFAESFIDSFILEDGSIRTFRTEEHMLDDINEGRVLFPVYQMTGKEKYRKAAEMLHRTLEQQPRTPEGSFWHKKI